jgi:predicted GH43/DUF377 family glycosyl hydrolase
LASPTWNPGYFFSRRYVSSALIILVSLAALYLPQPAEALVRLDFELKYFQHPQRQVWDFSIIRPDSVYHLYYHSIHESTPSASFADTIWHATSLDLKHWDIEGPVLTSGPDSWDSGAIWAPDVFRDEANNRWGIAYTGCDEQFVQRICMAYSDDLFSWTKSLTNPTVVPDTNQYAWNPDIPWSNFRDPFVYRQDHQWHILVTAKQWLGTGTGVLYHGTSNDLKTWVDEGVLFTHDGLEPGRVLESSQYHVIGDYHHLFFGEFDTPGITLLSANQPEDWTMANRVLLDYGYAPEIDEFDPGIRILSRLAPFPQPDGENLSYVVRLDTMLTDLDGANPQVFKPHPLDEDWAVRLGTANLGNPIFGDNPLWRGEPSVGMVGNGYYSSKEYYQGPLSGRGGPGTSLGDGVTGVLESPPFVVSGHRMILLVGGGNFPSTCFVALVNLADGSVIYSETGQDSEPMTRREWDLVPFQGLECVIRIVDDEMGPFGHINVDEIVESDDVEAPSAPTTVVAIYRSEVVDLDWDDAPEPDFHHHRIYRSTEPDFIPGPDNLLQEVTESGWTDAVNHPYDFVYKISTVDLTGNESLPVPPSVVSGMPLPDLKTGNYLAAAVPNPFNPLTRLDFAVARDGPVRLRIYDPAGRLVITLVDETLTAGHHHATWDGRDAAGRQAPAGLYLYRLETHNFSTSRRMTLLK